MSARRFFHTRLPFARLPLDRRGASAVEFALVAPIVLVTLLGTFDLGYNLYTAELLEGAIQKTARDATIEGAGAKTATLDARVSEAVHRIAPNATLAFSRSAYSSFFDVGHPEDYTDVNGNGTCDQGEPFEDANGNGAWDQSKARTGQGGARDAVLYQVSVTYPRPFPVTTILGMDNEFTLIAHTVLRNQPYETTDTTPAIVSCP